MSIKHDGRMHPQDHEGVKVVARDHSRGKGCTMMFLNQKEGEGLLVTILLSLPRDLRLLNQVMLRPMHPQDQRMRGSLVPTLGVVEAVVVGIIPMADKRINSLFQEAAVQSLACHPTSMEATCCCR
jgi:hypothetical protein